MAIMNSATASRTMKRLYLTVISLILLSTQALATPPDEPELDEDGNPVIKADTAPAWVLKDGNGNQVSSESLKDKAYVLHFWATWCPYCKRLQPGLDTLALGYAKKGIPTYAVSFWENSRAKPAEEMTRRGLFLPVLIGGDAVAKSFGVMGTPTTIFVNGAGEISYIHTESDPNDPQLRVAYENLLDSVSN